MTRVPLVGTGWKMNIGAEAARDYARTLIAALRRIELGQVDIFVLPPFTSLHAAHAAFAGSKVEIGGQNMHWDSMGAWTGEISAPMLIEAGCRYVELAHSERLTHFGETYDAVRLKVDAALAAGLVPILCIGEMADEKQAGQADETLTRQVRTVLSGRSADAAAGVILAYEPRWAIGSPQAASPDYVAERHFRLRALMEADFGAEAAARSRIIYGGAVTPESGPSLMALPDVDGLFIGRAAWTPEGFARMVEIVAASSVYP